MATTKQIAFLEQNRDLLAGPVLVVGSKLYDYDAADPRDLFDRLGVGPVVGTDIAAGDGVDVVADVCAPGDAFAGHEGRYATVMCMEMLTHVPDPFAAGRVVSSLLAPGGSVFLSECIVRKLSRMPTDHWRFSHSGLKLLFPDLTFHDERARMALVRDRSDRLLPLGDTLPEVLHDRHADETAVGHLLRRIHRKLAARGVFEVSRLMPETTIMAVGTAPDAGGAPSAP